MPADRAAEGGGPSSRPRAGEAAADVGPETVIRTGDRVSPSASPTAAPNAPPHSVPDRTARKTRAERKDVRTSGGSIWFRPSVVNAQLIYAAYLTALAIPFMALVGAFFAHKSRRRSPAAWLMTHYTYQMRTFWIGLGANVVAWILSFVGVGLLIFPLIALWVVARAVKGLIRIAQRAEIEDPYNVFI